MSLLSHYDLFVFDLDGTLLDSRGDIANAVNAMLSALSVQTLDQATIVRFIGHGVHQLMADVLGAAGVEADAALIQRAHDLFMDDYTRHSAVETRFYPGVERALNRLIDQHKKCAILTNKPEPLSIEILTALGHPSTFYPIFGATEARPLKPDPFPLLEITRLAGVPMARTLMIGDSTIDIETASRASCDALALLSGLGTKEALESAKPRFLIRDVESFADMLEEG